MRSLRWLLAPLAAGLLIVGCGGDKDSGPNSVKGDGSSGRGSAVSTELNLSNAANDLMELRSFRFDVTLKMDFDMSSVTDDEDQLSAGLAQAFMAMFSDIKMEGAYVAPDAFDMQMKLAGENVHVIQIGDKSWVNDGSGWEESGAFGGDLGFLSDPSDLAFDMLPEVLKNAKTKSEKVNGVETTRYSFDKKALEDLASDLGENAAELSEIDEANLDVWMTKDNIPVKISMDMKGEMEDGSKMAVNMELNVTDLNSDKVKIEAPI
jgi:ABC-type glycerol-3-phosphate transport system substrate-binding protein